MASSSSTFHFLSSISTSIYHHFHAAFLSLKHTLSHSRRQESLTTFNKLYTSIIVPLIAFLHYSNSSPFSTHPATMDVAVSCAVVYYLASSAVPRLPRHRTLSLLAYHLSLSFAYTSIAALVSVLLPHSIAPFVYAVSGSLSVAELLCFLYDGIDFAEFEGRRWRIFRLLSFPEQGLPV